VRLFIRAAILYTVKRSGIPIVAAGPAAVAANAAFVDDYSVDKPKDQKRTALVPLDTIHTYRFAHKDPRESDLRLAQTIYSAEERLLTDPFTHIDWGRYDEDSNSTPTVSPNAIVSRTSLVLQALVSQLAVVPAPDVDTQHVLLLIKSLFFKQLPFQREEIPAEFTPDRAYVLNYVPLVRTAMATPLAQLPGSLDLHAAARSAFRLARIIQAMIQHMNFEARPATRPTVRVYRSTNKKKRVVMFGMPTALQDQASTASVINLGKTGGVVVPRAAVDTPPIAEAAALSLDSISSHEMLPIILEEMCELPSDLTIVEFGDPADTADYVWAEREKIVHIQGKQRYTIDTYDFGNTTFRKLFGRPLAIATAPGQMAETTALITLPVVRLALEVSEDEKGTDEFVALARSVRPFISTLPVHLSFPANAIFQIKSAQVRKNWTPLGRYSQSVQLDLHISELAGGPNFHSIRTPIAVCRDPIAEEYRWATAWMMGDLLWRVDKDTSGRLAHAWIIERYILEKRKGLISYAASLALRLGLISDSIIRSDADAFWIMMMVYLLDRTRAEVVYPETSHFIILSTFVREVIERAALSELVVKQLFALVIQANNEEFTKWLCPAVDNRYGEALQAIKPSPVAEQR
jgi:hypothetical protein